MQIIELKQKLLEIKKISLAKIEVIKKLIFSSTTSKVISFVLFVIVAIAIPVTIYFLQNGLKYSALANKDQVDFFFSPQELTDPENQEVKLLLDSKNAKVAFVDVTIKFDPNKVKLVSPITPTPKLVHIISLSTPSQANQSGQIRLILGLRPGDLEQAPSGGFEVAKFSISSVSSQNNDTAQLAVDVDNSQVVNLDAQTTVLNTNNLAMLFNPVAEAPQPAPVGGELVHFDFSDLNNNLLKLANANQVDDGPKAPALSFNGSNTYGEINDSIMNRTDSSVTMAMWLKPSADTDQYGGLMGKRYNTHYAYGIDRPLTPRVLLQNKADGPKEYSSNLNLEPNQWAHLAVSIEDQGSKSQIKFYLNGELKQTIDDAVRIGDLGQAFDLGRKDKHYFKGLMDEVYVYGKVLNADEIKALVDGNVGSTQATGLQPVYQFNDEKEFNGQSDYQDLGKLDIDGQAITLSAWINASTFDNLSNQDGRIISKATGVDTQDHYWMLSSINSSNGPVLRFRLKTQGQTETLIANTKLETNQWIHVAAVYDGQHMIIYQNGNKVAEIAKSGSIDTNSEVSAWLGGNPPSPTDRPFAGKIKDTKIFKQALSEGEIKELMQ